MRIPSDVREPKIEQILSALNVCCSRTAHLLATPRCRERLLRFTVRRNVILYNAMFLIFFSKLSLLSMVMTCVGNYCFKTVRYCIAQFYLSSLFQNNVSDY